MARTCIALLVALACVAQAYGAATVCKQGAQPATPKNVRVDSQKYNPSNKRVEVVIAFDNPTNANTGCPQAYTISLKDSKGTALGGKHSWSGSPITTPIKQMYYLSPGMQYTINSVSIHGSDGKTSTFTSGMKFIPQAPVAAVPLRKML